MNYYISQKLVWALALTALLSSSCRQQDEASLLELEAEAPAAAPAPRRIRAQAPSRAGVVEASQPAVPVPTVRKIIRHANLRIEVPSVEESLAQIKQMVDELGGYVSNESLSEDELARKSGSITCRIPAEELDRTLEQLKRLGKVEDVRVSAQDITEQYFDLEIRIQNQKELETRLLDLLKRPTNKLSDLLDVERELARVRTEIDGMEGKKRFWDNQVTYSTLVIELHEPRPSVGAQEGGVFRTLLRSFGRAANNFVRTISGIIEFTGSLVPVAAFLLLIFWAARRLWRRWKERTA